MTLPEKTRVRYTVKSTIKSTQSFNRVASRKLRSNGTGSVGYAFENREHVTLSCSSLYTSSSMILLPCTVNCVERYNTTRHHFTMSQDRDIVDQVFSRVDSLYSTGSSVASSVKDALVDTVTHIGGHPKGEAEFHVTSYGQAGNSTLGSLGSFLYRRSTTMLLGCGVSAVFVVLFWHTGQLLRFPDHLPKSQSKCCLVLGDMHDPIIRSQVMDLYRRRFTVFVCSRDAQSYREHEEEDDFLIHIDPSSSADLADFLKCLDSSHELASILFMPNLAYHPSGEISLNQLESEIHANTLMYYGTLIKLLPHLPQRNIQLILFDPSLTYNIRAAHHSVEILVSGIIKSIYQSLARHSKLSVYMIHLGILQLTAQPSNYKYLNLKGSNVNTALLQPVYRLIMAHNGNFLLRSWLWIVTLGSWNRHWYCGRYSWLSTLPPVSPLIKKWF